MTSTSDLQYMLHHVFLPPKLPQTGDDEQEGQKNLHLLQTITNTLQSFRTHYTQEHVESIGAVHAMAETLGKIMGVKGVVRESNLLEAFENLSQRGTILSIYVKAQNAGLVIRRSGDTIIFESLELWPPNNVVIATKGRIKRVFPGLSMAVSIDTFAEPGLRSALAQSITKMSHQEVPEAKPVSWKAGQEHAENRDTTGPKIIVTFLMRVLEACGRPVDTIRVAKNTREEVLWSTGLLPWRRSPLWLLLRVAMQTTFAQTQESTHLYKEFMIFFMGRILELALETSQPSDVIHCMMCKISRRLSKLKTSAPTSWLEQLETTFRNACGVIQSRWKTISTTCHDSDNLDLLAQLDFTRDKAMQLPLLENFIHRLAQPGTNVASTSFVPSPIIATFATGQLPSLEKGGESSTYALVAFENWVASSLDEWVKSSGATESAAHQVFQTMQTYQAVSLQAYKGNPESISLMILTSLELWMAYDKIATQIEPMLLDYIPEIPEGPLQSLLLPLLDQMKRLMRIEMHLASRRKKAKGLHRSIFAAFGHRDSLAVRYYASSTRHQALRERIEKFAQDKRAAKKTELARKQKKYAELMSDHYSLACEYSTVYSLKYNETSQQHSTGCLKCRYHDQATSLSIEMDEWPLPRHENEARAAVFELDCPSAIGWWRDATISLLLDVLGCQHNPLSPPELSYDLSYSLSSFHVSHTHRFTLRSTTKPHVVTHRYSMSVSCATEKNICVHNGLSFRYLDSESNSFVNDFKTTEHVPKSCTYLVPKFPLLRRFIDRSWMTPNGPPPNDAISLQSECPSTFSLHEFKALATLPLGTLIQWPNVLLQLAMPSVDFGKVETYLVLQQIIRQAGPPSTSSPAREGHRSLQCLDFATRLLSYLHDGLARVKENWESENTREDCLSFLQACRQTVLAWARLLRGKAQETADETQRAEFLLRIFEISHVVASTFDVDDCHARQMLGDSNQLASFTECSIAIHDTSRNAVRARRSVHRLRRDRYDRLATRLLPFILDEVDTNGGSGMDIALQAVWSGYRPTAIWRSCTTELTSHWVTTLSCSGDDTDTQEVHLNLLNGELLVDGLPLSRLPASYETHFSYASFFGGTTVEVVPTAMPGSDFQAMRPIHGCTVYLGLDQANQDLLIAYVKDEDRYDLVPPRVFEGVLPHHFVHGYAHWRCRRSEAIELRPLKSPWLPQTNGWALSKTSMGWTMLKGGKLAILPMTSPTCKALSQHFDCIETLSHLHAILRSDQVTLDIQLPRLKVQFSLDKESNLIRSRQFRGMCLDRGQCPGTLVGLKSKIVLRNDQGERMLLVPDGEVKWDHQDGHVNVRIERETSTRLYPYHIDDRLGRLVDDGSLQSKLHLCYLHALTSHCLPDELTRKTGTEQAQEILTSAALKSFDYFIDKNLHTLSAIAKLTPRREYYPSHLREMQTVKWDSKLSFLSQPGFFSTEVNALVSRAASLAFFYEESVELPRAPDRGSPSLLERESIRNAMYRRPDYGAQLFTTKHDSLYVGRPEDVAKSQRTFDAASRVFVGSDAVRFKPVHNLADRIWNLLRKGDEIDQFSLNYDAGNLQFWQSISADSWYQLHRSLELMNSEVNKYHVMMFFATLAFSQDADVQVLQLLIAMYTTPAVAQVDRPRATSFTLEDGREFVSTKVKELIRPHQKSFNESPEYPRNGQFLSRNHESERIQQHQNNRDIVMQDMVRQLQRQWPCSIPQWPEGSNLDAYINTTRAMGAVTHRIKIWWDNLQFYEYLGKKSAALQGCPIDFVANVISTAKLSSPITPSKHQFMTTERLLSRSCRVLLFSRTDLSALVHSTVDRATVSPSFHGILDRLKVTACRTHEKSYLESLNKSVSSLERSVITRSLAQDCNNTQTVLEQHLETSASHLQDIFRQLCDLLPIPSSVILNYNTSRPSPIFFLRQLSRKRWNLMSPQWQINIVTYGLALSQLQRAERLISSIGSGMELINELSNAGHTNWNPYEEPESLLIEIESGILVRKVQTEIARQMCNPPGNANASMQLLMGEGKSSVIVPIAAASLADGSRLVRVVVGKAQSHQMAQVLRSKLGGLVDRQIYHMPFSRSLQVEPKEVEVMRKTYLECRDTGGILLLQPEHILSFKLMGIESLLADREELSKPLMDIQHFFDRHSRDIVDESDENFSVKFELIYTIGTQGPIQLCPERWAIIQSILQMIRVEACEVQKELPQSIEIEQCPAGFFPRIRFTREDAQHLVCHRVARFVCESGLRGFPASRQPRAVRDAIFNYMTKANLDASEIESVEGYKVFFTDAVRQRLLLLRGLLGLGVIGFALGGKRWRVNYGLDATRQPPTRLAVPFRAKDNPTLRSEFSHPDVVIVLTCLSYYYGGLEDADIFAAFEHLLKSNEADEHYSEWVQDAHKLPSAFGSLRGINLKDRHQCICQVFPSLRRAKAVVDYFLSHVVFPKEIREFPHKLSASGWDLAQVKTHPTTGFSGTNDSRHVLPSSMTYLDLDKQRDTNALVFQHLLGPKNMVQLVPAVGSEETNLAHRLLRLITRMAPSAQVILDPGAQILELRSIDVAKAWLEMVNDKQAVVFFDDNDELSVIDRGGYVEPLQISPFAKQLDMCLVFLDDAHTRGTDLTLPQGYRAAVTLGPGLTKDRLVQACMRMRKLGKGQWVTFLVPEEVQRKIHDHRGDKTGHIDVADILTWTIGETNADLRKNMPLWAMQGTRFEKQRLIWDQCKTDTGFKMTLTQAGAFLEKEALDLDTRYRPHNDEKAADVLGSLMYGSSPAHILDRCEAFDIASFASTSLHEEQERELSPEAEREQQVERPGPASSAQHSLHQDVKTFVRQGELVPGSPAFMPAFSSLSRTSAAMHIDLGQFPSDVLVTADFARTIKTNARDRCDAYQRPVQWIVTNQIRGVISKMIIISPFEAQELIPAIQKSSHVHLHIYAPRWSLTYPALDNLKLYTIPSQIPWHLSQRLIVQLNIFSGQLYFSSLADYRATCDSLGLAHEPPNEGVHVDAGGFIISGSTRDQHGFTMSPTSFLEVHFAKIRRDSEGIDRTHWGRVLGGQFLVRSNFDQENC